MSEREKITLDDAAAKMQALYTGDQESDHADADDLLVETLLALHGEAAKPLVDAYNAIPKWYA